MATSTKQLPEGCLKPLGESQILQALNELKPGQMVAYHTGYLPDDRRVRSYVDRKANHAYWLGKEETEEGRKRPSRVHLTQIRVQAHRYIYLATGKRPRLAQVR